MTPVVYPLSGTEFGQVVQDGENRKAPLVVKNADGTYTNVVIAPSEALSASVQSVQKHLISSNNEAVPQDQEVLVGDLTLPTKIQTTGVDAVTIVYNDGSIQEGVVLHSLNLETYLNQSVYIASLEARIVALEV